MGPLERGFVYSRFSIGNPSRPVFIFLEWRDLFGGAVGLFHRQPLAVEQAAGLTGARICLLSAFDCNTRLAPLFLFMELLALFSGAEGLPHWQPLAVEQAAGFTGARVCLLSAFDCEPDSPFSF